MFTCTDAFSGGAGRVRSKSASGLPKVGKCTPVNGGTPQKPEKRKRS